MQTICNIYQKRGHKTNDCQVKELGGQYVRKDIPVNIVQPEALVEQVKQEQNFQ